MIFLEVTSLAVILEVTAMFVHFSDLDPSCYLLFDVFALQIPIFRTASEFDSCSQTSYPLDKK